MSTSPDTAILEVLNARAASYRMFSRLFLKPLTDEDIDDLVGMGLTAKSQELQDAELLSEGFYHMGQGLRRRHSGTRQQLATDFTMCFDGVATVGEQVAVPYASVFLSEKALLNQEPRGQVYRLFQAEGIGVKRNLGLPEDHLSFELEFLAELSTRAATALVAKDDAEAIRNLQLSARFIDEHILSWIDLLFARARKIIKTRFYRGVLQATRGYISLDQQTIDNILEVLADE